MRRSFKKLLLFLCLILVIGFVFYSGKIAELYLNQSDYLYHPNTDPWKATPSVFGIDFEEIEFFTEDGVGLSGWWVPQKDARWTILLCKGIPSFIKSLQT
jgi:hypothetical protein